MPPPIPPLPDELPTVEAAPTLKVYGASEIPVDAALPKFYRDGGPTAAPPNIGAPPGPAAAPPVGAGGRPHPVAPPPVASAPPPPPPPPPVASAPPPPPPPPVPTPIDYDAAIDDAPAGAANGATVPPVDVVPPPPVSNMPPPVPSPPLETEPDESAPIPPIYGATEFTAEDALPTFAPSGLPQTAPPPDIEPPHVDAAAPTFSDPSVTEETADDPTVHEQPPDDEAGPVEDRPTGATNGTGAKAVDGSFPHFNPDGGPPAVTPEEVEPSADSVAPSTSGAGHDLSDDDLATFIPSLPPLLSTEVDEVDPPGSASTATTNGTKVHAGAADDQEPVTSNQLQSTISPPVTDDAVDAVAASTEDTDEGISEDDSTAVASDRLPLTSPPQDVDEPRDTTLLAADAAGEVPDDDETAAVSLADVEPEDDDSADADATNDEIADVETAAAALTDDETADDETGDADLTGDDSAGHKVAAIDQADDDGSDDETADDLDDETADEGTGTPSADISPTDPPTPDEAVLLNGDSTAVHAPPEPGESGMTPDGTLPKFVPSGLPPTPPPPEPAQDEDASAP
jgi:hypothetical protein